MQIESAIEAILFSVGSAVTDEELSQGIGVSVDEINKAAEELTQKYINTNAGIRLLRFGNSYQLASAPEYYDYIREVLKPRREQPLSHAALEVLSVIAYHQPVVKSQIEFIRGVDCSATVNRLAERGLIEECGRKDAPGKPILYRTTPEFLRTFGLSSLDDLPEFSKFAGELLPEESTEPEDTPSEENA